MACADEAIEEDAMTIQLASKRYRVADAADPIEFCYPGGESEGASWR